MTMPAETARINSDEILRYQAARPLSQCPGFRASVQVRSPDIGPLFIALRPDALEIYTAEEKQFIYDLEGRPIRFSTPNEYRFRGVSNQGIVVRKRPRGSTSEGTGMIRDRLDPETLEESCREAWLTGKAAAHALDNTPSPRWAFPDASVARAQLGPILEKIKGVSPQRLRLDEAEFTRIYQPVPVLPPDHYASFVVQATEGCSFNTCTFCALYRDIPFRVRSQAAFEQHLRDALAFHGEGLRRFTQIFLGQANALAIPQHRLLNLLQSLRQHVELPPPGEAPARPGWAQGHPSRFTGIGSFLDGFTGLNKTSSDYAELRALGLVRIYLGVESGSPEILDWLRKPATPDEMLQTLELVKESGIAADTILLVGAGGAERSREHVDASLALLQASALRPGDRVFLSEIVQHADTPYLHQIKEAGLNNLSPTDLRNQTRELACGIRALGLQPVPYRIEPFAY